MGGGGFFGFFGFKRRQQQRRGHEVAGYEAEETLEPWQRKVRRTDEDNGRWVAGLDIDKKATEFIDRVHRRMNPDQLLEASSRSVLSFNPHM